MFCSGVSGFSPRRAIRLGLLRKLQSCSLPSRVNNFGVFTKSRSSEFGIRISFPEGTTKSTSPPSVEVSELG